ncbi:hypothetical protein pb186bvf_012009 [Paramecium bursaria]
MMILFLILDVISGTFHRILLIDKPAVDMKCQSGNITGNLLIGPQYFYDTLSNGGQVDTINEITFTGFVYFNNSNIYGGKQVIFYFIDGYQNDQYSRPFINLGLSFQYDKFLKLQVLGGDPSDTIIIYELPIGNKNTQNMTSQWYHFVVSVNIQSGLQFLNLKFYSMLSGQFFNYQTAYIQTNIFTFKFSPLSRITNERIYGFETDTRLCGSLAKFTYYVGFSTMDQEQYVDYFSEQIFQIRAFDLFQTGTINLQQLSAFNYTISMVSGIKLFLNSQIKYALPSYDNLTISFWMLAFTTQDFQIVSLIRNDSVISLALGVTIKGNLAFYSNNLINQMNYQVNQLKWMQITLSYTRRYYSQNFTAYSNSTMVRIIANGQTQIGFFNISMPQYSFLIFGTLNNSAKDQQYIQLYDIRIFYGFSIITSTTKDCSLFSSYANKSPCLKCSNQQSTYCYESPNPGSMDITEYYNCPAGFQEQNGCPPIEIPKCLRTIFGVYCSRCPNGYSIINNQCVLSQNFVPTIQDCGSQGGIFCSITNNIVQAMVCGYGQQYSKQRCIQGDNYYPGNCSHVYMVYNRIGCYNCIQGTYNKNYTCVSSCVEKSVDPFVYKFGNQNWCTQTCPQYYDYFKNCTSGLTQVLCQSECQGSKFVNTQNRKPQAQTRSCWFQKKSATETIETWLRTLQCDPSCQYCFHTGPNACLSCSDPLSFFDPWQSTCLKVCDTSKILPFSDYSTMQCVQQCQNYQLGNFCYDTCPILYYPYLNQCVQMLLTPINAFNTGLGFSNMPSILLFMYKLNGVCQAFCNPMIYSEQELGCVDQCPIDQYQFLQNGYDNYCFLTGCGLITGNLQTYSSVINPQNCVLHCGKGNFGQSNPFVCAQCSQVCLNCYGKLDYCTSCKPQTFLINNQCSLTCPFIYDYVGWACVTSCKSDQFLVISTIQACVSTCTNTYFPLQNKQYLNSCIDTPPRGVGCDANNICYQCDSSCSTCDGPSNTNCLSCFANTYLLTNKCTTNCGLLLSDQNTWKCSISCSPGTYKQGQYCSATCLQGSYKYNNACFEQTPLGTYCQYSNTKLLYTCNDCYTGCNSCTNNIQNSCQSCKSGYYYYNNQCLTKCPSDLPVMNSFINRCTSTCEPQYFLYDNICQSNCPIMTYKVVGQNVCFSNGCGPGYIFIIGQPGCQVCSVQCATCIDTQSNCVKCSKNYYLSALQCISQCPNITPYHNTISQTCDISCPDSSFQYLNSQNNLKYCLQSCSQYQLGMMCYDLCPSGYFPNVKRICQICNMACLVCTGSLVTQCSKCTADYYLNDTSCVKQCPSNKPIDQVQKICLAVCYDYIYKVQSICLKQCPSYLIYYTLNGLKECVATCYDGSFNQNGSCASCSQECSKCYGVLKNQCTQCVAGYYLQDTTCSLLCKPNYFYDSINRLCVINCPLTQFIVLSSNQCVQTCQSYNYGQICVDLCPSHTYIQTKQCLDCDPTCEQCLGATNQNCQSCIQTYYLNQTICSQSCPKYYDDVQKLCVDQCLASQLLVFDTLRCVSICPSGYKVSENVCVANCKVGQYLSGINCFDCDTKCLECSVSATNCSKCAQNFVLQINVCDASCSNIDLFIDLQNNQCQSICPPPLYHYYPTQTIRKFCVNTCSLIFNQICINLCPDGYYQNNDQCALCSNLCILCTSLSFCTKCIPDYYLTQKDQTQTCKQTCDGRLEDIDNDQCVDQCLSTQIEYNNQCMADCPIEVPLLRYKQQCLQQCPDGTYRDSNQCLDCDKKCSLCYEGLESQCLECVNGYFLNLNTCQLDCPLLLQDKVNNKCVLTCDVDLIQDGQTCVKDCPMYQYKSDCYVECPPQTYVMDLYCVDCALECSDCSDQGCLKCQIGYLLNGMCVTECPTYYNDITFECADTCDYLLVQDHCQNTCPPYLYQYLNDCYIQCPVSTYSDNSNICIGCDERCLACTNAFICKSCLQDYFLYKNRCVPECPIDQKYMDTLSGVCQTDCPANTFIEGNYCNKSCDNVILYNLCLTNCPDGYYQSGSICNQCQQQCFTCTGFNNCQICKSTYYLDGTQCNQYCLEKLMNQITWQCSDDCQGVISSGLCLQNCPLGLFQFNNYCYVDCPNGYYGNQTKCVLCPNQCLICSSISSCSECQAGYYLEQDQCVNQCSNGYGDSIGKICVSQCPQNQYKYEKLCVIQCPKSLVQKYDSCATQCGDNQFNFGQICKDCSIECDQCRDFGNQYCIKCAVGFQLQNDRCTGQCPEGYYSKQGCIQCNFECLTCDSSGGCLTCRGDRQEDCKCPKGYFDDGYQEQCQMCPCLECTSATNCTKCKNNLQPPNCFCNKKLNDDYCIACDIAYVNIFFTNSLNIIVVDFNLLVNVDVDNPFKQNDCTDWFNNSQSFGVNSLCQLNWNRTQIYIYLGSQATVLVGDQLLFQQNMFKYVNDEICEEYIQLFINSTIKGPNIYLDPYIIFDNPSIISPCMENQINQIQMHATGSRDVIVLKWELQQLADPDHYQIISEFLLFQGNNLRIPPQLLKPNYTYLISVTYVSFINKTNQTILTLKTHEQQLPYIYLDGIFLRVYIYDCVISNSDLDGMWQMNYFIRYNNSVIQKGIVDVTKNLSYQIPTDSLQKGIKLAIEANIQESSFQQEIILPYQDYKVNFSQSDRFVGTQFQLQAKGNDLDIQKEIQSYGFKYEWLCTNKSNLQPCKNQENKIITFQQSSNITVNLDTSNITLLFYVKVSKNNRSQFSYQSIIVSDFNQEYQFIRNNHVNRFINPNDMISVTLKENQLTAIIMQDEQVIDSIKISGQNLKFVFSDIAISNNPVIVYLLPGIDSLKFELNPSPKINNFSITPLSGYPLDNFTYHVDVVYVDDQVPFTYNLYYYQLSNQLEADLNQNSHINGIPLIVKSLLNSGNFSLPDGLGNQQIHILLEVFAQTGSSSYALFNVTMELDTSTLKELDKKLQSFFKQSNSISNLYNGIQLLKSQTSQVCLKQCSGVGTCMNNLCQCPFGYYFDDCSGTKQEFDDFKKMISEVFLSVLNTETTHDMNFLLYVRSLNYLRKFDFISINDEQSTIILDSIQYNLQLRLNQINQFTIGLQSQNTSEFNYNSMETLSIVNKQDLQTILNVTNLIWGRLLENFTNYELQYKLRKVISNTIELYLSSLLQGEQANLTYDAVRISINRTNSIDYLVTQKRRLLSQIQYYDVIQALYLKNLYCLDGYFPYPLQCNPLYDYQVRQMSRLNNIYLNTTINYTFPVDVQYVYVCIQRDQSFNWINNMCKTVKVYDKLYCNCSLLAPTTYVRDYLFIFVGSELYRINIPNIVIYGYLIQIFFIIILYLLGKGKNEDESNETTKFGRVIKLHRKRKVIKEASEQLPEIKEEYQEEDVDEGQFKYDLSHFHFYHHISKIIYKSKKNVPLYMRVLIVLFRWSSSLYFVSLYTNDFLTYDFAIYPSLGIIVLLRLINIYFERTYKEATYFKDYLKILMVLFIVVTSNLTLMGLISYQAYEIQDQTDWFISYYVSLIIDLLFIDLMLFGIQKYLGADIKKKLKKRIEEVQNIQRMQQQQRNDIL